jgi:citrate lyase subunit beta/citryl-CoA lyase
VHVINLPKPESPDAVRAASEAIGRAERANGVKRPIGMLLNIESPKALRMAAPLALADSRVVGLQMGLADLFEPLGIFRGESAAIQQTMFAVRLAAGEAGIYACDSVFADINDVAGFRAEAALARRLGFIGKSCIHPQQVALANEAFRPSDAEISHALRVLAAAREAEAQGLGAYLVDGKMIDAPFLARARAIVASASQLGLLIAQTEDKSPAQ